ncbi:MAG: hypothetical protein ABS882_07840 [Lysinibacillus sp.]
MKIGNLVKTAIKFAPVVYPIVKKVLDERKKTTPKSTATRRK